MTFSEFNKPDDYFKQKSDTITATKRLLSVTPPYDIIKRIRSTNGTGFTWEEFRALLVHSHIKHQNGTTERQWKSLFNMIRYLVTRVILSKSLGTCTVMASVYIRNRCYNSRLNKTLCAAFTEQIPDLSNMHIF